MSKGGKGREKRRREQKQRGGFGLWSHTGEFINQNERRPITLIEKKGKEQLAQEEISQERGEERKE